jgi:hypothetical protein
LPVTYELEPGRRLMRTRLVGELTPTDLAEHFRAVASDPACPLDLWVLLDATGLTGLPSTELIRIAGSEISQVLHKVKIHGIAVVVKGMAAYGVFRMGQVLLEPHFGESFVSRDFVEAESWLGERMARAS